MERILRDELMPHCGHLIDPRQHGFLRNKSCTTQLIDFFDSSALSSNNNIRSDEYLKGRTQRVFIGGSTSSELPVLSEVPQGSILVQPCLFYFLMIFLWARYKN